MNTLDNKAFNRFAFSEDGIINQGKTILRLNRPGNGLQSQN